MIKSTIEKLEARGYLAEEKMNQFDSLKDDKLAELLTSTNAVERTSAAGTMGKRRIPNFLPLLCEALKKEKKLYSRIAICGAIAEYGTEALKYLIPLIGTIGTNQHKKAGIVDIKKKSYPLPRDIIIRIIIRIGCSALPLLEEILKNGTHEQKAEAIDAVGHIAFNYKDFRSEKVLLDLYLALNDDKELLKWKIIKALQSFNSKEVIRILQDLKNSSNTVFKEEAERSLMQIERRNTGR